jgi:PhnB protein
MSTTKNQSSKVEVYLFLAGRTEEVIEFYKSAVDAQVEMLMRFKESPEPPPPGMLAPGWENKVMHSSFRIGETVVMASDGCGTEPKECQGFNGFSLALAVKTEAEADRAFNALAAGGQVTMPLNKTFWSPRFGMLTDKFGVGWMINVVP